MTDRGWKCRDGGNRGKAKTAFPRFPPSLGNRAKAARFPHFHPHDGYLFILPLRGRKPKPPGQKRQLCARSKLSTMCRAVQNNGRTHPVVVFFARLPSCVVLPAANFVHAK